MSGSGRFHRPRSKGAVAAVTAVVIGVGVLGGGLLNPAGAGADDDAADLLSRARTSPRGLHVERVGARSAQGRFVVGTGSERFVGSGPLRFVAEGAALERAWQGKVRHSAPAVDASWDLELAGAVTVAGRAATIVIARDQDGAVRGRFAIDRQAGQLLRTEVLDRTGAVVRSIGFVQLTTDAGAAVPAVSGVSGSAPVAIGQIPAGFVVPRGVGSGYRLVGSYQRADGSVQLYYSDGLFTLSVFEQSGTLDWRSLPAGGRAGRAGTVPTRTYSTSAGTVVVWADGQLVMTCIADGPPEVASAAVARMNATPAHDQGVLRDIADFVLGPFGWN
jgi:MucB/RseB family protein